MTKQLSKKHQFSICTLFVFIGLMAIYSPSYGGTYNGGPAGGIPDGVDPCAVDESGESGESGESLPSTINHLNYKTTFGPELESSNQYTITTYHDEMTIYVGYPATVQVKDSDGELLQQYPHSKVQQVTTSGLQPNTTYIVSILGTCDVEVRTEPSPESEEFPSRIEIIKE